MRKLSSNFKSLVVIGLSGALIAVCFMIVTGPTAEAQFTIGGRGRGFGRFFRNFQRGAQTVFRPIMQPMTGNNNIIQQGLRVLPVKMPEIKMPEIKMPQITMPKIKMPVISSSGNSSSEDKESVDKQNSEGGIGGTKKPQATGIDKPFPDDCGRHVTQKTGLLCFPDGKLCEDSELVFNCGITSVIGIIIICCVT